MNLFVWDHSSLKTSGGAPFMALLVPWGAFPICYGAAACGWPPDGPLGGPGGACPPGSYPDGVGGPWAPAGSWPPGGPCAHAGEAGGAWPGCCCCAGDGICSWAN
jgi:hypothetical protein